ncbi:hypothetical protein Slin15195_G036920 [Septoria linicola]|uniref:Uncharacterized protein n=1 Tax=Septoria linicola TaxID=215465 RepID=A0A9Q9EII2_9PEZI|nr:hypothetical protein Slin15195_G036920 [Septoria linicola]
MKYLALFSAGLLSSIALGQRICETFGVPKWKCDVCGSSAAGIGSSPVVCDPFNATYDELTANKPVGIYKSARWQNFITTKSQTTMSNTPPTYGSKKKKPSSAHFTPISPSNLARLPSGKKGIISFGYTNGTAPGNPTQYPLANLYFYHYGCLPSSSPPVLTPCTLHVSAECVQVGGVNRPTTKFEYDVQYKSASTKKKTGTLAYHQGDKAKDAGFYCYSDTMTATGTAQQSKKVDLYVDDVIDGTLRQR